MSPRLLAAFLVIVFATPVAAHDWYPWECCHAMDCAPVEQVRTDALQLIVTSKHGTVAVPASFPRRESKDTRMHVCMRQGDNGKMKLLCIFLPPAM